MSTENSAKLVVEDPNYSSRYFKALAGFRAAKRFTDITLQVADTEFVAHRAVLSAASPFFNAMFDDAFLESQKEKVNLLHETNEAVMSAVLDYMYSGKLTIAIKEAGLLLRNFDYFQMDGVKGACEKALLNTVNAENCLELLLMAEEISLPGLHEKAADCLLIRFKELCNSDEINQLTLNQLEVILSIGNVRHPDATYKIIMSWIRFDETNRNSHIHHLLSKYVKADNLSEDLMVQKVPKYIFNDDFIASYEGGAQWLLESFFNLKHSNLYIFSTNAGSPVYAFNPKTVSLHQIVKQSHLDNFSAAKYKDSIYVVGGQVNDEFTDECLKYDLKKKSWTNINCPIRKNQCGLCLANDKMYIVGGWANHTPCDTVSCFDFETSQLSTLPNIEFARYSPGVTCYNSSIYVFGGHSVLTDDIPTSFVERYDPREGKWAHAGTIDSSDVGCTCASTSNSIYWKEWNGPLQDFDPRCQLSGIVQELTGFGTITSFEDNLYYAHETGISLWDSDDEQCTILFMSSFKMPFVIA